MNISIARRPAGHVLSYAAAQASFTGTKATDAELIERIAEGDKSALQILFARHSVAVYRFALRLVKDGSLADDVVNELFLDVWRYAGNFEGRSQVSTWLLAIARNKAVSMLRVRSEGQLDEEAAESIEDPTDTPETAMQKKEHSSVMRACLTQLSPAHREIIDLVYYHEKSIGEVAQIIGIGVNTVKTRMFYARKHLEDLLGVHGITSAA